MREIVKSLRADNKGATMEKGMKKVLELRFLLKRRRSLPFVSVTDFATTSFAASISAVALLGRESQIQDAIP